MTLNYWQIQLEEACTNGNLGEVIRLTKDQSDFKSLNIRDAVRKALFHDHTQIVIYFLRSGMPTHYLWPEVYETGRTSKAVFEEYIASGMEMKTDHSNPIGPPLAWVLERDEIIELFLQHGADPNACTYRRQYTGFSTACAITSLQIIQLLVAHGANASPLALRGAAAGRIRSDQTEIIKYILGLGVDIDEIPTGECLWPRQGQGTVLWHAASQGNLEAVKSLLELGADPSIKSTIGTSPLEVTRQRKREEIVALLGTAEE